MKLIIDNKRIIGFGAIGVVTETFKARQSERLTISVYDDDGALTTIANLAVSLKTSKASTTLLAEVAEFAETTTGSKVWRAWMDLNTEAIVALNDGARVFCEVSWTQDDNECVSDDAWITIQQRGVTGDETAPAAALSWWSRIKSYFSDLWFSFDDEAHVVTPLVASQSAAETGTATTGFMSPLRTAQAIAALAAGGGAWDDITNKPEGLALVTTDDDYIYFHALDGVTLIGKAQLIAD